MSCLQDLEQVSGNIYIRPVRLAKEGDILPGHKHNFDHTTFVISGRVKVVATCDEGCHWEKEFDSGEFFLVKKDWKHQITALTDGVRFACIYSHRTPQGEVTEKYDGFDNAYAAKV